MEKVLFHHGGTKLPSQRNKMFTMMERMNSRISAA